MHGKLLCVALTLYACSDSAPAASSRRGVLPDEQKPAPVAAPAPPPPPPPPRSSLDSPFAKKLDPAALQAQAPEQTAQEAEPAPSPTEAPKRDLSAELAERLGSPTSCLDLEKVVASGGRLDVVVVAQVMPSGRITRAQVTAADQPGTSLHCLESKATSASLKGPVPGAPLAVSATLPIEVASQPTPRSP